VKDLEAAARLIDQDPQCEDLYYAAGKAFENKTGRMMAGIKFSMGKPKGIKWSEEELPQRFPALCARFGYS